MNFTRGEWLRVTALMKASFQEGNTGLDEIMLGALIQAETNEDLVLVYRMIESHQKDDLVDADHPRYEDLVRIGCIDHPDCPDCAGTGIGRGDPDTSRCCSCGGRGYPRIKNEDYEPDYDRDSRGDDYFDRSHDYIA